MRRTQWQVFVLLSDFRFRVKLCNWHVQEAQLISEKRILELRVAELRLVWFDFYYQASSSLFTAYINQTSRLFFNVFFRWFHNLLLLNLFQVSYYRCWFCGWQAYDQMQQALVDAASKALSYRQDILEENIRLTYAVQVERVWKKKNLNPNSSSSWFFPG